jgi:hypothetical protein
LIEEFRRRIGKPRAGVKHLLESLAEAERDGRLVYKPHLGRRPAGYYPADPVSI